MRQVLGLMLAVTALGASPAAANDTSLHNGRHGPEPVGGGLKGPESVIRMVAEKLDVTFGRARTHMRARFTFRNMLPSATATQLVGFPDEKAAMIEAERRGLPFEGPDLGGPLQGLRTTVDGKPVQAALKYGFVKWAEDGEGWVPAGPKDGRLMAYHAVTVAFPPGQDVVVERTYSAENGSNVLGQHFFEYITHSGGVWQGTIGELVADVTLTDGLTTKDLAWAGEKLPPKHGHPTYDDRIATRPGRRGWQVLGPKHLRLVWRDFEPRTQKDRTGFAIWTKAER